MTYVIYTYNKIQIGKFEMFRKIQTNPKLRMHFGMLALFFTIIRYFEYRIRIRCI